MNEGVPVAALSALSLLLAHESIMAPVRPAVTGISIIADIGQFGERCDA